MPEELRKKGFITLCFDKYENEYFIIDHLNHHVWWFDSYTKALDEFEKLTERIK